MSTISVSASASSHSPLTVSSAPAPAENSAVSAGVDGAATDSVSALFRPVSLGALHLRNRVVMGPLTRNRGVIPDEINAEYYAQRARHSGLIISEGILVEPQGSEWSFAPGLFNAAQVRGWKKVTAAVHAQGGLIVAQLWHLGRCNHPKLQAGLPIYAPSAIAAKGGKFRQLHSVPGYQLPEEISAPEHFVELFKSAAVAAKSAGFDGVELQGAGGYLVHQFLDPSSNHRNDQWGGSIENRSRFALSIIDALISVWGAERVSIRLQPAGGFNDMGFDKEQSILAYGYLLNQLSHRNIAFVEMERYMAFLDYFNRGTQNFDTVRELRKFYSGPWIANGGYSAEEGGKHISSGLADAISYSRPFIANPDLPYRFRYHLPLNEVNWENVYGQKGGSKGQGYVDYPSAEPDVKNIQTQAAHSERQN